MDSNPYHSPPPLQASYDSHDAVRWPAISLIVVSCLCLLLMIPAIGFDIWLIASGAAAQMRQPAGISKETTTTVRLCWDVLLALVSVAVLWGGIQMLQLRNYKYAYGTAVLAAIPCVGPCCLLGVPTGIWALFVLHREEVRQSFR